MKGRKRVPTTILQLRGSRHAAGRAGEPTPGVEAPKQPTGLFDEIARGEWSRVTQEMLALGTAAIVDHALVESHCVVYSRWRRAEAALAEQGAVIETPNGSLQVNPNLSVANEC